MKAASPHSLLLLVLGACTVLGAAPEKTDDLYQMAAVWPVQVTLSAEEYAAMEPREGGMPGGERGERVGPGPAGLLMPVFLKGDGDHRLTKEEFQQIAKDLFTGWDRNEEGSLDSEALRAGLGTLRPAAGPPPSTGGAAKQGAPRMMEIDFPTVHGDVTVAGTTLDDVGVRYKGNASYRASRGQIKRSLKLDLNQYTKGQKLAGVSTLNLHSNVTDPGWMNEAIGYWLYREAGVPAPRTAYARVSLTVPGKYEDKTIGLYSLVEQVDRNFLEDRLGTREGALFKPEGCDLFAYLGEDWADYEKIYDPKTAITAADKERVIEFTRIVDSAGDEEFAAKLDMYVDVDEVARYFAVTVWLASLDSPLGMNHNYYVYLDPKTRKFQVWPWDLDLAFGKFGLSPEGATQLSIAKPWNGTRRFIERLFAVASFRALYEKHLKTYSGTIFAPARIAQKVAELGAALRGAVAEESAEKLAEFEKLTAGEMPEAPSSRSGTPGDPAQRNGPDMMRQGRPIVPFATARSASVEAQLAGRNTGTIAGGRGGPGGGAPPFLADAFLGALDANGDGVLSREEFATGFARWFDAWDTTRSGVLTEEQLRAGLNKDLRPAPPGGNTPDGPPPPPPLS